MTNPKFVLNFLNQPTRFQADPNDYRDFFESYDSRKWQEGGNGGSFKYFSDDGKIFTCLIAHSSEHGILVQLGARDTVQKKRFRSYITVGNKDKLNDFVDIGSDEVFSVGCFVSPQKAWILVREFLREPTKTPSSALLIDASLIPIPEIYQ